MSHVVRKPVNAIYKQRYDISSVCIIEKNPIEWYQEHLVEQFSSDVFQFFLTHIYRISQIR